MIKKILIGLCLCYLAVAGILSYIYTEEELNFKYEEIKYNWDKKDYKNESALDRIRKCNENIEMYRESIDSIFTFTKIKGESYIRFDSIEKLKIGIGSINMEFYYINEALEASADLKYKEHLEFEKKLKPQYKALVLKHNVIVETLEQIGKVEILKDNKLYELKKIIREN